MAMGMEMDLEGLLEVDPLERGTLVGCQMVESQMGVVVAAGSLMEKKGKGAEKGLVRAREARQG